jgi:ABC-type polysaccharide/polyol phosphate transport system ATPase subunit
MPIIEVSHVTKEFELGQLRSLKQMALDAVARLRGHSVPERAPFKALDDVDFKVEQGEVLGIIGQNGAGKSTLLKLLARVSTPTHGTVKVHGSVAPLIEVGAGFVPELTGRENIYLNGAILGMRRTEIAKRFDEIVAFAELEQFIDTPIKRYSTGMHVRLGFSLATSVRADILIIDEVLAVGDLAFQRKCFDRMEEMIKRQGKTVLLVSHNIRQVDRLCSRVMLIDHGRIAADGETRATCDLFYERSHESIKLLASRSTKSGNGNFRSTGEMELLELLVRDEQGRAASKVTYKSDVTFVLRIRVLEELDRVFFGIGIHTTDFFYLTTHTSEQQLVTGKMARGDYEVACRVRQFPFLPGVYSIRLGVAAGIAGRTVFYGENLYDFQVIRKDGGPLPNVMREGFVALDATWHPPRAEVAAQRQAMAASLPAAGATASRDAE